MSPRHRALWLCCVLLLLLPLLLLLAAGFSDTGREGLVSAMQALLAELRIVEKRPEHPLLMLRLWRGLCAIGVGGTLALAGAMTQGLFRNPLAEPGLLGIGTGASLGAIIGIALLGGYAPDAWTRNLGAGAGGLLSLSIVPIFAFVSALATALTIYRLATRGGRIAVPTLLLTGLAVNALLGAFIAAMQSLLFEDWQVSRAILAWGFGTLNDRGVFHLVVIGAGAFLALATIPFVGLELDLLAGGEEDAAALGADPVRIKTLVLAAVALATAAAVSVSGQIAFLGLLVPHLARSIAGPHHRMLLPLSFLLGAALLLSVVVLQFSACPMLADWLDPSGQSTGARALRRITALQPGVLTSLIGAPWFLWVLLRQARLMRGW